MAYLGNNPIVNGFQDIRYQDLTGGSGTLFTLDHHVNNAQAIEVFVNNVRQEPGVAYTVSGTALTMTGTIATTDDFYVVFQGAIQPSASHPATSNLEAVDGTFSGSVEITGPTPFWENSNTISSDYTITNNRNALSIGPVTIADGVTVTIGDGENWTVL